jgi:CheY-like chemotaxis protein
MGGLELHDRLLGLGRRIPVIFVTAYPQDSYRERALAAGAVGFLAKPFAGKR